MVTETDNEPRLTVEQRREQRQADAIAKHRKQREEQRHIVAQVAATAAGKQHLRWLMNECGFNKASTSPDKNGEISAINTVYNEARRNIWLELRQVVPPVALAEIEAPSEVKDNE